MNTAEHCRFQPYTKKEKNVSDFVTFRETETKTVRYWFASNGFFFQITEKDMDVFGRNLAYEKKTLDQFSITATEDKLEITAVSSRLIKGIPTITKTWTIQKIQNVIHIFCTFTCYGQEPLKVASKVQIQENIECSDLGHGW